MRNSDGLDDYRAGKIAVGLKEAIVSAGCNHEMRPVSLLVHYVQDVIVLTQECKLCQARFTHRMNRTPDVDLNTIGK